MTTVVGKEPRAMAAGSVKENGEVQLVMFPRDGPLKRTASENASHFLRRASCQLILRDGKFLAAFVNQFLARHAIFGLL
jgi:hypothetical protein